MEREFIIYIHGVSDHPVGRSHTSEYDITLSGVGTLITTPNRNRISC
jgi:hypothetical protein